MAAPVGCAGFAVAQWHVAVWELRAARLGDPLEQRHHPVFEIEQLGLAHRIPWLVGPELYGRPRGGIVGQPLAHPNPLTGPAAQRVSVEAVIDAFGDPGQNADITAS